jgi:ATP-dependent RNA helicase RhlE
MSTQLEVSEGGFASTGLSQVILAILAKAGFDRPTPIQEKAIPVAMAGVDILGIAQTGTGKTLAFVLPIIERLIQNNGKALIVVPTRELALQAEESIRQITYNLPFALRTVSLIGGVPIYRQLKDLKVNPRIILATPGRLQDHLNQGTVKLGEVKIVVLDEADRMLDMGFAPQINSIMLSVPKDRQTMLFSATMATEVEKLTKAFLRPEMQKIEISRQKDVVNLISQEVCYLSAQDKPVVLGKILAAKPGTTLIFSRTKHGAAKLASQIREMGHTASEIHSDRSLSQRRQALAGFKTGSFQVLVATDVAARGIDVKDISLVINYDLPDASEDYIHRIGRTGRAGKNGKAISFATHDQWRDVKSIEKLIAATIPVSEHSQNNPVKTYSATTTSSSTTASGGQFRGQGQRSGGYQSRNPFQNRGQSQSRSQSQNRGQFSNRAQASNRGQSTNRGQSQRNSFYK